MIFFFFAILIWISDFHCLGALGVGPGALTLPHVLAWSICMIIAIVEPRSKSGKKGLAIVLP